jgi:hypothetical protein
MPTVFLSHASQDREFVERELIPLLRENGVDTWYSRETIRTSEEWEDSIRSGLNGCDWFLVVLSPRSVTSDWVRTEVHWALDERPGRVVPVLLESCNPSDLHLKLRRIQHVDFTQDRDSARAKLLEVWGITRGRY